MRLVTISQDTIFPKQRTYASLVTINEKLYLFGGLSYGKVLNDVWSFDLRNEKWTLVSAKGQVPAGRYFHAARACGDVFVVWGGQDGSGFKDDLFIFNSVTGTWTQLAKDLIEKPAPAAGTCMVIKDYMVYLFGGKNDYGVSNELWLYNIGTNEYRLIDRSLQGGSYNSYCWIEKNKFFVSLGSILGVEPSTWIRFFDFDLSTWQVYHHHKLSNDDSSHSTQIFTGTHLISIGGQVWDLLSIQKVVVLGPSNQVYTLPQDLDSHLYACSSSYFNKSLYIFGGGRTYSRALLPNYSHNQFIKINIEEICSQAKCKAPCSPGSILVNSKCEVCPAGSYVEGLDKLKCESCRPGTFNTNQGSNSRVQCLPCPQGFFNDKFGADRCEECPEGKFCPVGSKNFIDRDVNNTSGSEQPSLYKEPDLDKVIVLYQTLVSVPLFCLLIFFLVFRRFRRKIHVFDMYDDKHEGETEFIIKRKTIIGACFSFLFVIGSLLITCTTIISYFKANIYESKALVPLVVLEKEFNPFNAETISLEFLLFSYGGNCESLCSESAKISLIHIQYSKSSSKCESKETYCMFKLVLYKSHLQTGSKISLTLNQSLSYTSGIQVNLTSSSSIPNEKSSVLTSIKPQEDSVFLGSAPTEFFFLATTSLFTSESDKWQERETGYHVSEFASPKAGSQARSEDLPTVNYLNLVVVIDISSNGLITRRTLKQELMFFAGGLIGTVSGLFGVFGFFMALFEKYVRVVAGRRNGNKKGEDVSVSFDGKDNIKVMDLTNV